LHGRNHCRQGDRMDSGTAGAAIPGMRLAAVTGAVNPAT
jgi:hypothetical protein